MYFSGSRKGFTSGVRQHTKEVAAVAASSGSKTAWFTRQRGGFTSGVRQHTTNSAAGGQHLRKQTHLVPAKAGFTLIELLVVIAIIGLLASVVMASLNSAREKGRDSKRLADLRQLELALQLYYDDHGYYPCENRTNCSGQSVNANGKIGEGGGLDTLLVQGGYMPNVSADPLGPGNSDYWYYYDGSHGGCGITAGGSSTYAALYVRSMENENNGNLEDVCPGAISGWGGEGMSGSRSWESTRVIILGASSG